MNTAAIWQMFSQTGAIAGRKKWPSAFSAPIATATSDRLTTYGKHSRRSVVVSSSLAGSST